MLRNMEMLFLQNTSCMLVMQTVLRTLSCGAKLYHIETGQRTNGYAARSRSDRSMAEKSKNGKHLSLFQVSKVCDCNKRVREGEGEGKGERESGKLI